MSSDDAVIEILDSSDSEAVAKRRKTRDERNADQRAKTTSQKIKTNLSRRKKGATLKTIHAAVAAMPRYSAGEEEQLLSVDDPRQIYFWSGQQKVIPSQRRLLLVGGGQTPAYRTLQSRSGKLTTKVKAKNKSDGTVKGKETNVERGNNVQKHHLEAEAIQASNILVYSII
jgi:hypothetical protein